MPSVRHLWGWSVRPVALLRARAAEDAVFSLRLWRPTVVGYSPQWNKTVLTDTRVFASRGSLAGFTPYLAAGIVVTDHPRHRPRRQRLNPHFTGRALADTQAQLSEVAEEQAPHGRFEALSWASATVRRMLNRALFGGALPEALLRRFLDPLHQRLPGPMLPRTRLFADVEAAVAAAAAGSGGPCLATALAELPGAVEELRVALAAGYDTTAHTLAWLVWTLAAHPAWRHADAVEAAIDEVLRLYPPGWIGSRVATVDAEAEGVTIRRGTLVLYSPLLTHRDPSLWSSPDRFDPERFLSPRRPYTYLPFAAGPRTCLGAALARMMLRAAVLPLCAGDLEAEAGDDRMRSGLTLRPRGPLRMRWRRAPAASP